MILDKIWKSTTTRPESVRLISKWIREQRLCHACTTGHPGASGKSNVPVVRMLRLNIRVSFFCSLLNHRVGILHAADLCQFEPSIAWSSLRSFGTPLPQGGSGHGLHLHAVFKLPSTKIVQLGSQVETRSPDNATAWQPAVFDCSRKPLLLSGYFQHVKCVGAASLTSRNNPC